MITEDGMASKSPNPELDEQVVLNFRAVKQLVQLVLLWILTKKFPRQEDTSIMYGSMDTSWSWICAHGQSRQVEVVPARCWHDTEIIVWTSKGPPGNQWDAEASRRSCADKSAGVKCLKPFQCSVKHFIHIIFYHIGVVTSCHINPHYSSLTAAMIESQSRSVIAVDLAAVSSQSDRQVAALPDLLRCLPDEFWACSCYWMLLVLNREMIQSIYI